MLAIKQQKKRTGSQRESWEMLQLQTDPTTNQAERTCFMALLAATSSFRIKEAWKLCFPRHWCAGFNPEAKMDHYSTTAVIIHGGSVYGLCTADSPMNSWIPQELLSLFQQESGFMLRQVTIMTPNIARCMSTDIWEPRNTVPVVIGIQLTPMKFEWGVHVTEAIISKGKSRRWRFTMSHWTRHRYKHW